MIENLITETKVPNKFPTASGTVPYRIAIVGESPGENEVKELCPFVGASGSYLNNLLTDAGIRRELCYVGNVCQYRPPGNKLDTWDWNDARIQLGLAQLKEDIAKFQPNLVILLGGHALRAALGTYLNAKGKPQTHSISNWRGSVFMCQNPDSPFYGVKCLATYHPSYLFKVFEDLTLVRIDMKRARRHGCFKEVPPDGLVLDTEPNFDNIIARLKTIYERKIPFATDIEGYVHDIKCISLAFNWKEGFIVPFQNMDGSSFWKAEQEAEILYWLDMVLSDPRIPKTLQNGMYDRFVLAYTWAILIRNIAEDTLLKYWELYAELEKDLGTQCSVFTDHAFYKGDIDTTNQDLFWRYCCKDSVVTKECADKQQILLAQNPKGLAHYRFNMDLQDPFLFIELRGIRIDSAKRRDRIALLREDAWFDNKTETSGGREQMKLEEMAGWKVNTGSNKDMPKLLYEQLKLPVQLKKRANGGVSPTTDEETLLRLGKETGNPILMQCLKVRRIRKRTSGIEALFPDPDGRIRASTNIVGTKTGRTTSSKAPTGRGTNLTTVTPDDRDILVADEAHDFGQCDLEGADSWTVAAWCAAMKDPTMLDDLLFGIKPAQALACMVRYGVEVNKLSRPELKALIKKADLKKKPEAGGQDLYYICKRGTHGSNYRMGPKRLSDLIFMETDGEQLVSVSECVHIQNLYFTRYSGVHKYHEHIAAHLKKFGYIDNASGSRRLFFGRKDSDDTIGDACSSEPQHNTTWTTNRALLKLWNDPKNKRSDGSLIVWPCHQVHDALCLQWHMLDREFARTRIPYWFDNPITIAGIQLRIPYEGKYGSSWGEQPNTLN